MSLHKFSIFYAEGFAMPGVQFPQLRRFGAPMWWGWSRWQLQSHSPYETQSLVCSQNVPVIHNIYIYSHVYIYICIHFIYIYIYTFIPYIHDGVWVFTMNGAPKRAFLSRMIFATRILGVTLELPGLSNQNALWKSLNRLMPCIQVATTFKMRNPFVVISTSAWFQVLCFIITRCYMIVIQIPIQSSGVIFFQKLKLESMNLRICIQKKIPKAVFSWWLKSMSGRKARKIRTWPARVASTTHVTRTPQHTSVWTSRASTSGWSTNISVGILIYHLVMTDIAMENPSFLIGKPR